MPSVFISYSRRDKGFVERLHEALSARGFEVWVDWEDIPPSAEWLEEIRRGILGADGVIYVISPDSVVSEVCTRELEHAIAERKRVVPVVARDPGEAPTPEPAAALNWVFLRPDDDFDAGVETLVSALETDLDHVRAHTRLGVQAERWEASGRERSQLLRGAELARAEAWLVGASEKQPPPTQLQSEYLLASRRAASRRQRVVIGGVSLALVVAIVLGVVALIARNAAVHDKHVAQAQTQLANAQLDDTRAEASLSTDPQQSVHEAILAVGFAHDADTENGLREALTGVHLLRRFAFLGAALYPNAVWSPDGTRLLVTSPGFSATIYSLATGKAPIKLRSPPSGTGEVAWDAGGNRVIIGGTTITVYDADSGAVVSRLPGRATEVALSSDGTRAATVSLNANDTITGHVYDVAGGRLVATFKPAFSGGATCLAWAPNDSVIAQCDAESAIDADEPSSLDVWDPTTGRLLHANRASGYIDSIAFSADSSRYVYTTTNTAGAGNPNAPGTFVDTTATGATLKTFPGGGVSAVFSPNGAQVAYSTLSGGDLAYIYTFSSGLDEPLVGATAVVDSVRFNAAGTEVVAGSEDGAARVYDANGIATEGDLLETLTDGDTGSVKDASFGLDGTEIATASNDGTARLWSSPEPQPSAQATLPYTDLTGASFAPGAGTLIGVGLSPADAGGEIASGGEILSAKNLHLVARLAPQPGYAFVGAATSRNGAIVAALAEREVAGTVLANLETFDGRTGRRLATVTPPAGAVLEDADIDSAGDRLVASYGDGDAEQWDPSTGRRLELLHGSLPAVIATYSHDGSILAIVHEPPFPAQANLSITTVLPKVTIDLWNARSGRFMRTLTGPPLTPLIPGIAKEENGAPAFAPLGVAFSADGDAIALVGADRNVWAFSTRKQRAGVPLAVPQDQFADSVAFSPNNEYLAVGVGAGAFVWTLKPNLVGLPEFSQGDPSQYTLGINGAEVAVGFTSNSQVLVTVGDGALKVWDVADQLQIFDAPATRGGLDVANDELVATTGSQLSVYPCNLCGGLGELLALAAKGPKD